MRSNGNVIQIKVRTQNGGGGGGGGGEEEENKTVHTRNMRRAVSRSSLYLFIHAMSRVVFRWALHFYSETVL